MLRRDFKPFVLVCGVPHTVAILAGDDTEAVVLDFVQPSPAGWRLRQSTRGDSLAVKTASYLQIRFL